MHGMRRGSPPTLPILRASYLWSEEEDSVLIQRYREFRERGKLQGYSQYIAMCLPKKTDRQVRDQTKTLKEAGILLEPPKAEQQPLVIDSMAHVLPIGNWIDHFEQGSTSTMVPGDDI
ncbi:hypothetical protein J6590_091974 [Homalodisca vitripennis]|nr:hypothetical protein J6590_091974 [Homalodisca vitripennis]